MEFCLTAHPPSDSYKHIDYKNCMLPYLAYT